MFNDTHNNEAHMDTVHFTHEIGDFTILITVNDAGRYTVTMVLAGEVIRCDDIKFVMDEEEFDTFTYADWVNYFNVMKEEWAE